MSFCLPWWRFCLAGALGEVCCAIRPARWKRGRPSPMTPPQAVSPNLTGSAGTTSRVPTSSLNSPIPMRLWSHGLTNPTATFSPPSPTPPIPPTSTPTTSSAAAPQRTTSSTATTSATNSSPPTKFPTPMTTSEYMRPRA